MLIWNRREVMTTLSMKRCAEARGRLAAAGIEYDYKCYTPSSARGGAGRRTATPRFTEDGPVGYIFHVYVHKKDKARAQQVLGDLCTSDMEYW